MLTDDIRGYLWGKTGDGAMPFATALTNGTMAATFANPVRCTALIALTRDAMRTARAKGVMPGGKTVLRPRRSPRAQPTPRRESPAQLDDFNSKTAKTHSGIGRDLVVRKRRTEVDAQLGAVTAVARGHGISAPLLDRLVQLIPDIEGGHRTLSTDSFAAFAMAHHPT